MNMVTVGAVLLLLGGIINTIPAVGKGLAGIFDGTPVVQIALGVVSLVVGIMMIVKHRQLAS